MGIAENKQVVSGFIDALSSGNLKALDAALAEDATWWLPGSLPVSGTHRGKKGIFEGFLAKAGPLFQPGSLAIEVRNTIAEGDCVAVEWIARGKTVKGKPYENYYHIMFEVKNGKVQTVREYVDTLYAKEVLFS
ncbi:MAG: nuclear transport factor 2 family protein [Deltaproteobacteria bacterium]|nr:nuclear transport factor 2 family protein [Deltaproteobacteria bacterium]